MFPDYLSVSYDYDTTDLLYSNSQSSSSLHCLKNVQIRSFFWSIFSCIRTGYGNLIRKLLHKSQYSVQIQENTDQKKLRIWTLFTLLWWDMKSSIYKSLSKNIRFFQRWSWLSLSELKLVLCMTMVTAMKNMSKQKVKAEHFLLRLCLYQVIAQYLFQGLLFSPLLLLSLSSSTRFL